MAKLKLDQIKIDQMVENVKKKQEEGKKKGEETVERLTEHLKIARRRLRR